MIYQLLFGEEIFYLLLREALGGLAGIISDIERIWGNLFRLILLSGRYLHRTLSLRTAAIVKRYSTIIHEGIVIS